MKILGTQRLITNRIIFYTVQSCIMQKNDPRVWPTQQLKILTKYMTLDKLC
jgi:hypothetical protein